MDLVTDRPGLRLRPELLAAGWSDADLARSRARGELDRVRRGAYVAADDERLHRRESRHALAARAAVLQLGPGAVVSHVSAAVVHGLPAWGAALDRVHVTRHGVSGGHRRPTLHVHVSPLRTDEVTAVDGVAVTAIARTLADTAASVTFEQAVVVLDAALRRGAVTPTVLAAAVERQRRRPGVAIARCATAFADAGAQSVGESRSRVLVQRWQLPAPVLQWTVPGTRRRCAFGWPRLRAVGEFDGPVPYGRALQPGQPPGEAVVAERRREDEIRDAGFRVIRWTWAELDRFDEVAARLRATFATA